MHCENKAGEGGPREKVKHDCRRRPVPGAIEYVPELLKRILSPFTRYLLSLLNEMIMPNARLSGAYISLTEALADKRYRNKVIAVHGTLYQGVLAESGDFVCLPKDEPFGVQRMQAVQTIDPEQAILLNDPMLESKFEGVPALTGWSRYVFDSIIVGRLRKQTTLNYRFVMSEIVAIILLTTIPLTRTRLIHGFHIINFAENSDWGSLANELRRQV